jgi:hypothetical protein
MRVAALRDLEPTLKPKAENDEKLKFSNNAQVKISKSVESHILLDSPVDMSKIYTLRTRQIRIHVGGILPPRSLQFILRRSFGSRRSLSISHSATPSDGSDI